MLHWFLGPLRQLVGVLTAHDSTRQIAAGATLGVLLGLTPKGCLLALGLVIALGALRVNKAAGLASAAVFSAIAPLLDSLTHQIGLTILMQPSLDGFFTALYEAPLGPWIGFHNTVTLGSFLVGLYLSYPIYLATRVALDKLRPVLVRWIMRYKIARALFGLDMSSRLGAFS